MRILRGRLNASLNDSSSTSLSSTGDSVFRPVSNCTLSRLGVAAEKIVATSMSRLRVIGEIRRPDENRILNYARENCEGLKKFRQDYNSLEIACQVALVPGCSRFRFNSPAFLVSRRE